MAKWLKVGAVTTKRNKPGVQVSLGDKFRKHTVTVIVKDESGNVVAESTDGYLQVMDPRKNPKATPEQLAKIPDFIKQELFIVTD